MLPPFPWGYGTCEVCQSCCGAAMRTQGRREEGYAEGRGQRRGGDAFAFLGSAARGQERCWRHGKGEV
eukprot:5235994-Pyramimonas_sp.AAC.1